MPGIRSASHQTYARWTVDGVAHAVATTDAYRGGVQYEAALAEDAPLGERWIEEVARGGSISLRVVDRPDLAEPLLAEDFTPLLTETGDPLLTEYAPFASLRLAAVDGLQVAVEVVTAVEYDDDTSAEFTRSQTLTTTALSKSPGSLRLTLTDLEETKLNTLYPTRTYQTSDWPLLLTSDAGRAVPNVRGIALKLPCVLISTVAPYRYIVAEGTVTVLTVYRGKGSEPGRVVPSSEYTTGTASIPWPHTWVEFTAEQRDFDGSLFAISADVQTTAAGINVATEIGTLLAAAGVTVNAGSLAAAETFATAQGLLVDLDHGRDGQRTVRAIVEDLLWVLRATLGRNSAGAYTLTVDGTGSAVAAFDEDAGDDIEVIEVTQPSRPQSVAIEYRPSPRSPQELQHVHARSVAGGVVAAQRPRALRYVRRHETADRCADYRAKRAALSAELRARIYRRTLAVGDVITVASNAFDLYGEAWRVWEVRHIVGGVEISALPYDASLASYSAGTLPADAVNDYQPDYSQTPPLAPTSLRITSGGTDAVLGAYVAVDALPPAVNWATVWFVLEHNTTGELIIQPGQSVGGGREGLVLSGMRAGEIYKLSAYAANSFGLRGATVTTFNATGIGGGPTDTTFNAPGVANGAPAAPTGLRVTGGATDASLRAFVAVDAIPPSANAAEMWFVATHNSTGDAIIGRGQDIGGGRFGVTLGTLRIGEVYQLRSYAVSALGAQGGSVASFDATGIGGGNPVSTFTAPGTAVGAPAAPTSMRVTATAAARQGEGTITARATADCIAPTSNAADTFFVARHSTTNEETLLRAESVGGGRVGVTFTALRPGEVYALRAYSKNALNQAGPAVTSFDASAIGGGNPVSTFTTGVFGTAPATPASINVVQGVARTLNVSWAAVADPDLADYELERRVGAGAYSVIWRGKARSYVDIAVAYGSSYQYQVRARSTSNVFSGYQTSSSASLSTGSVTGGSSGNDIGPSTVSTSNRSGVTTVSAFFAAPTLTGVNVNIGHSLGKVPIASANTGGKTNAWVNVNSATTIAVDLTVYGAPNASDPSAENAGNPHQHVFIYPAGAGTASVDLY